MEKRQPMQRDQLMVLMWTRRDQLNDLLNNRNLSASRRKMAQRLLWYINGTLEHKISFRRLQEVYQTYKDLDLVPEGYMYAALHMHREAPLHIQ